MFAQFPKTGEGVGQNSKCKPKSVVKFYIVTEIKGAKLVMCDTPLRVQIGYWWTQAGNILIWEWLALIYWSERSSADPSETVFQWEMNCATWARLRGDCALFRIKKRALRPFRRICTRPASDTTYLANLNIANFRGVVQRCLFRSVLPVYYLLAAVSVFKQHLYEFQMLHLCRPMKRRLHLFVNYPDVGPVA